MGLFNWLMHRAMKNEAKRVARLAFKIYSESKSKCPNQSAAEILKREIFPNLDQVPDKSRRRAEICCETVNGLCYMMVLDLGKFKRAMNFRSLQFTTYMDYELEAVGFPRQPIEKKEKTLEAMGLAVDGWQRITGNAIRNEIFKVWKDTISQMNGIGINIGGEEVDYIVIHLFLADEINPDTFFNNLQSLLLDGRDLSFMEKAVWNVDERKTSKPTKSVSMFWGVENRPSGYPLWFLAAYPDVAGWLRNTMKEYVKSHNRDYDGWERISLSYMGIAPGDPNLKESDVLNNDGSYRATILKNLVQSYKDNTHRRLETSRSS